MEYTFNIQDAGFENKLQIQVMFNLVINVKTQFKNNYMFYK